MDVGLVYVDQLNGHQDFPLLEDLIERNIEAKNAVIPEIIQESSNTVDKKLWELIYKSRNIYLFC